MRVNTKYQEALREALKLEEGADPFELTTGQLIDYIMEVTDKLNINFTYSWSSHDNIAISFLYQEGYDLVELEILDPEPLE